MTNKDIVIRYPFRPCKFCGQTLFKHLRSVSDLDFCSNRHGIRKDCEYCNEYHRMNKKEEN